MRSITQHSHVAVSFEAPEYTADVDAIGTLRLLEAIRFLGLEKDTLHQASTSELYETDTRNSTKKTTPFYPRSPYAVAKMYLTGSQLTIVKLTAYLLAMGFFNHESPRRGGTFA